ncbi:MAG: ROK family protein, partial [Actinomycetota bacterium]|nr:ROK family protein [Actinomycetota bacterium]
MATRKPTKAFGIDIGGTGIKGCVVNLSTGELIGERFRKDTPQPSTPASVAKVCGEVAANFNYAG